MKKLLSVLLAMLLVISAVPMGVFDFNVSAETDGYYTYYVYSNNEVRINDVDTSISGDVIIPSTLGGYPVTSIGGSAFQDCSDITGITIPDSVTSINSYAFNNCSSLTNITIPKGVAGIGRSTFYGCSSLENVYITDLAAWCNINFYSDYDYYASSNPLYYAENLYLNGELVTELVIPSGVTQINKYAFCGCNNITSVTIPDSVTSIGEYAFNYCTNISKLYISDVAAWCNIQFGNSSSNPLYVANGYSDNKTDAEIYLNNQKIRSLEIPSSVKAISDYAFYNSSITGVTIPDGVETIGNNAFSDCGLLRNVNLSDNVTSIGTYAFSYCPLITEITLPKNLKTLGVGAFSNCSKLKTIEINEGITTINNSTFYNCSSLTDITIPSSVTIIGYRAFYGCDSLTDVIIPDGVTVIGDEAFYWCGSLTNVTIPDSVTSIGQDAFNAGITNVYISDLAAWCNIDFVNYYNGSYCYSNPLYNAENLYLNGELVTELVIPSGVTQIKQFAFNGCNNITSVAIPDGVTSIGEGAFYDCYALNDVSIPNSVKRIDGSAFQGCPIKTLSLGSGVEVIGESAFYRGWYSLDSVTIMDVYYTGTEEQRYEIGIYQGNDNLENANWYYNICAADEHIYASNCDTTCNICKVERKVVVDHTFDNDCDTTCNVCDFVRVIKHRYSDTADRQCNKCDFVREVISLELNAETARRTYLQNEEFDFMGTALFVRYSDDTSGFVNDYDVTGFNTSTVGQKSITLSFGGKTVEHNIEVIDGNTPIFTVQNGNVIVGGTVTVAVNIKNNPGVSSFKLNISYDRSVLSLESMRGADFKDINFGPTYVSPTAINWANGLDGDNTTDGIVAYLTFRVNSNTDVRSTRVHISYDSEDVFDSYLNNVDFKTVSGTININEYILGDISGDTEINSKDLSILMQYLNYWYVSPVIKSCDVNGDNKINNKDYIILQRYINGWDVELL